MAKNGACSGPGPRAGPFHMANALDLFQLKMVFWFLAILLNFFPRRRGLLNQYLSKCWITFYQSNCFWGFDTIWYQPNRLTFTRCEINRTMSICYELKHFKLHDHNLIVFMARSKTKLRVGILSGIDKWANRCNLPSSGSKLHVRHLPMSDIGCWAMSVPLAAFRQELQQIRIWIKGHFPRVLNCCALMDLWWMGPTETMPNANGIQLECDYNDWRVSEASMIN